MLELRKIDRNNVWQVARLKVKRAQADYVASNIESILEAFATREAGGIAAPFALYDGVALVGFVMIGYGDLPGEENPAISAGNYCLWRLMIDERWQGRGYGKQAIEKAVEYVRTKPFGEAEYCWLSYDPDNQRLGKLYHVVRLCGDGRDGWRRGHRGAQAVSGGRTMKILRALLALALLLTPVRALAQEAKALTADCVITSGKVKTAAAHDGDYTTAWRSERVRRPYLEFELPEGETAGYLYVCFTEMPQSWAVEERVDGKWRVVAEGGTDYLHALVELNGQNHFRIVENSGVTTRLKFNEVFVFGEGELPDWVQRWQPTAEKADLLVLATHPDDELIFFGGTIPTYAVEREKSVVVAYMSGASAARRSELLNGLWHMGVRQYPVIGPFGDAYSTNMAVIYDQWGRERVRKYVMGLIRRYKPDVVVTHDRGGEYGHGAHKVTADASVYCVENAANPSVLPALCEAYGAWTVKKLYLHMGEENVIRMDWNVPLSAMGGKTGEQLAQEAFLLHVTQQKTRYVVTDEGKTGNAKFSLVYTTVGPDIVGGDFFENVE